MAAIICIIIAYLIGSINTGIILAKIMKSPDPRTTGSGSAGATNVLRTMGKNQAIVVLVGDFLKGLIAVWIGYMFSVHHMALGFVALAAVLGHVFPLYFKFKGGKGVATAVGSILGLSVGVGILLLIVWVVVALLFKYSSLASLIAAVCAPIFMLLFGKPYYFFPVLLIAALIIWMHKENIHRLRIGTESKIQF